MKKKHIVFSIDQVTSLKETSSPGKNKDSEQISLFGNEVKSPEKAKAPFTSVIDIPTFAPNNEAREEFYPDDDSSLGISDSVKIELPKLSWFIQKQGSDYITNIYTGSLGTNPTKGCLSRNTFNYRVYVDATNTTNISLIAECWLRTSWADDSRIISQSEHTFDASDDGLCEVEEWLVERYLDDSQDE